MVTAIVLTATMMGTQPAAIPILTGIALIVTIKGILPGVLQTLMAILAAEIATGIPCVVRRMFMEIQVVDEYLAEFFD